MKTKISDIRNGNSCVKLETVEQFIKCFGEPKQGTDFDKGRSHGVDFMDRFSWLTGGELEKLYPLDAQRCDFSDIDWEEEVSEVEQLKAEIERLKAENEQLTHIISESDLTDKPKPTPFNLDDTDRLAWEYFIRNTSGIDIKDAYLKAEKFQSYAKQRKAER